MMYARLRPNNLLDDLSIEGRTLRSLVTGSEKS
jgi:hypothetical protein